MLKDIIAQRAGTGKEAIGVETIASTNPNKIKFARTTARNIASLMAKILGASFKG